MTDILAKLADLHKQATEERSHNYVGACVDEAYSEILRLRALVKDAPMPLARALHILTEVHTREDHAAGFTVERTAWPDMRSDESRDYIEAWRAVRFNIGKQTEPQS